MLSKAWSFIKKLFKLLLKPLKALFKWVRHPLKSLGKLFMALAVTGKGSIARRIISMLVAYVVMMFPGTIAVTSVSTYPFTKMSLPAVLTVMQQSGFGYYLTYGIGPCLVAGAQSIFGDLLIQWGGVLGNEQTIQTGRDWAEKGAEYASGKLYGLDGVDVSALKFPAFRWPWEDPDMSIFDNVKAPTLPDVEMPEVETPEVNGISILPPSDGDAADEQAESSVEQRRWTEWDESESPNYWRLISQKAEIDVSVPDGTIKYFGLDELGRTQRAVGMITYEMVEDSAGSRSEFEKNAEPSGWPSKNQYVGQKSGRDGVGDGILMHNGKTYKGYMWNRSHLIADALGGYDYDQGGNQVSRRVNLITGTRAQNVGANDGDGGMQHCESLALKWLKANQGKRLWYSVEPIYEGDELIPRSVIVKMLSEDGSLQGEWEIYNCAKGYEIDYSTGDVKWIGG